MVAVVQDSFSWRESHEHPHFPPIFPCGFCRRPRRDDGARFRAGAGAHRPAAGYYHPARRDGRACRRRALRRSGLQGLARRPCLVIGHAAEDRRQVRTASVAAADVRHVPAGRSGGHPRRRQPVSRALAFRRAERAGARLRRATLCLSVGVAESRCRGYQCARCQSRHRVRRKRADDAARRCAGAVLCAVAPARTQYRFHVAAADVVQARCAVRECPCRRHRPAGRDVGCGDRRRCDGQARSS